MIRLDEPLSAVRFTNVAKSYSGNLVVDNLCLSIPYGTIFGLIGPNGAGKSTSLKALMGLLPIDGGEIEVFGHNLASIRSVRDHETLRRRIGYVPETHTIYRWMKVREAIKFVKSFHDYWNDRLVKELLDLFALDASKSVKQLSKGMLAKLALLLAVLHEPELLILDEPTSGLDPLVREEFLHGILQTISDQERTIIFSSHSIDDVQRLADTVGLLKAGNLVLNQSVETILEKTKRLKVALKDDTHPQWTPGSVIWQRVQRREWELTVDNYSADLFDEFKQKNPVEHLEVQDLSLEDIFKDYFRPQIGTARSKV